MQLSPGYIGAKNTASMVSRMNSQSSQWTMPEKQTFSSLEALRQPSHIDTRHDSEATEVDDTLDPRNWSPWRKGLLFLALMSSSLLADGGMVWGATLVVPQAIEWEISISHSASSINYGILLQGIGGLIAVPFMNAYGRLPVWFWSQITTLGLVIGCCFAKSWSSYTALRSLQGLFGTVPQVVGLPIIHDMYRPTEWPKAINVWSTTFLVGPFLGPAFAGYCLEGTTWRGSFGVLAGLYGLSTLLILTFGRETYYGREDRVQQTDRPKAFLGIGNAQLPKRAALAFSTVNMVKITFIPPLLLVGMATMVNFTWPIGITTTVDSFIRAPPYLFGNVGAASFRFAGVIGALLGYALAYMFNEWISASQRRHGLARTEQRLHGVWLPTMCLIFGLLIYGLSLNYQKSWVGLAFGWAMVVAGFNGANVAITAFALEKYSKHSAVVAAILNMWRTAGGFSVGYFQPSWIKKDGVATVFAVQAAIVAFCIVLLITPVFHIGKREAKRKQEQKQQQQQAGEGREAARRGESILLRC